MKQTFRIDRIIIITHKMKKKRVFESTFNRYLAKSHIKKAVSTNQKYEYLNFRGSIFSEVDFENSTFCGCDFWGTAFTNCIFKNVIFTGSIFVSSKFNHCIFSDTKFEYCTIVTSSIKDSGESVIYYHSQLLKDYPSFDTSPDLDNILVQLKADYYLKKNKILFLSENKINKLNLFLLNTRFGKDKLPLLLEKLINKKNNNITTYKKLENVYL